MEPEVSLLFSEEPITGSLPHPEPEMHPVHTFA